MRGGLAACIIMAAAERNATVIEILHGIMGILHRITTALSPEERLLSELADITGRHHELADRLARHAGLCAYPNIVAGLVALAACEAEHARALDAILSGRHVWSKLPRPKDGEGSNNWARIGADLALLLDLSREMNQQALRWEGLDPPFAARLRAIAVEDNNNLGELRELALKCDPQALD
jgi:hypothetical protein